MSEIGEPPNEPAPEPETMGPQPEPETELETEPAPEPETVGPETEPAGAGPKGRALPRIMMGGAVVAALALLGMSLLTLHSRRARPSPSPLGSPAADRTVYLPTLITRPAMPSIRFDPATWTTDPAQTTYKDPVLTPAVRSDLLLFEHVTAAGISPAVTGRFDVTLGYFATQPAAAAVGLAAGVDLTGQGFHALTLPPLQGAGVTAYETSGPDGTTQRWLWQSGTLVVTLSEAGVFAQGTISPDQSAMLGYFQAQLRTAPAPPLSPRSVTETAAGYADATGPIAPAQAGFIALARTYDVSTTGVQAETDAAPLVDTLRRAEAGLAGLAVGYPPARRQLLGSFAAIERSIADLGDLHRLGSAGLSLAGLSLAAWQQEYAAGAAALAAADTASRAALGLSPGG